MILALLFALAAPIQADTSVPPTVVVVRHAEKADASRDTDLSAAGYARARALDSILVMGTPAWYPPTRRDIHHQSGSASARSLL